MWTVFRKACLKPTTLARNAYRSLSSSSSSGIPDACLLSSSWADPFTLLIQPQEHRLRQTRLVSHIHDHLSCNPNKKFLLIIPAAKKGYQADTKIPHLTLKQTADFVYLTGLNCVEAANSVLIIVSDEELKYRTMLFIPFLTEAEVTWEGHGLKSPEFAKRLEGICDSLENVKYVESFISEESGTRNVFTTKEGLTFEDKRGNRRLEPSNDSNDIVRKPVLSLSSFLDKQRLFKSESEVKCMKRTCSIGSKALSSARDFCKEVSRNNMNDLNICLINESQVAAKFDFESRVNGANKLSYPSVVAGGPRATFIHYGSCNKFMKLEDWLLMDAGCEDIEGYVSDITRCWMISGQENIQVSSSQSRLQAALYEALCEVQHHLMNHLKSTLPNPSSESLSLSSLGDMEDSKSTSPGVSLDNLFQVMCVLLGKVLIEFGVIPKSSSASESARFAYKFCPHHVSHFLGLDVHDTPSIPRSTSLKPGMCFTLEPGLYFKESDDVKKEFKGIGLRVEDDLLIDPVTSQLEVLTKECLW